MNITVDSVTVRDIGCAPVQQLGLAMIIQAGTQIELRGTPAFPGFPGVAPERATITRPRKSELPLLDGFHVVKFADGGKLCVHETGFRVL